MLLSSYACLADLSLTSSSEAQQLMVYIPGQVGSGSV